MRTRKLLGGLSIVLLVVSVATAEKIQVLDNCDSTDPAWPTAGGCLIKEGDVTLGEFILLLHSPLSSAIVGHPAWRNQPSYHTIEAGNTLSARNEGGNGHTFTEVATFGGGRFPPFNGVGGPSGTIPLIPAPECLLAPGAVDPTALAPGATLKVTDLGVGLHRFQCCIHPWMRAAVRVTEK